jgi:catechol 2,3-dioxygenase-like lactoylglutathione lyase family enzyme
MAQFLALVTIVVDDYDEAISYYCDKLGFNLVEDTVISKEKRWIIVSPQAEPSSLPNSHHQSAGLLLAKAADHLQKSRIGDQTGGRVGFFLKTDRFEADYARMIQNGVVFNEPPRCEPYGRVVVFVDLYGNKWDMLEVT